MAEKGFEIKDQKLIYKGKKQDDNTKTLGDLGFKDGEFMVVMAKKVRSHYPHNSQGKEEKSAGANPAKTRRKGAIESKSSRFK